MKDVNPFKDAAGQVNIEVKCNGGTVTMRFIQGEDAFEVNLPEAEYAKLSYERIKPFRFEPKQDYKVQINPATSPLEGVMHETSREMTNWDPTEELYPEPAIDAAWGNGPDGRRGL